MKKQYLIVEHRQSAAFLMQKQKIHDLSEEINRLQRRIYELESLYGCEVAYNAALCDLCRNNGISFRSVFDHTNRSRLV